MTGLSMEAAPGGAASSLPARVVRVFAVIAVAAGLVVVIGAWYLSRGEPNVDLEAVWAALVGEDGRESEVGAFLIRDLRLPRLLLGLLAGAALALAGAIMQDTLRNPIADPGLLGISQAAALSIAVLLFFPGVVPDILAPVLALGGGILAGSVLVLLARSVRDPVRLILIGALMSVLIGMVTSVLILVAPFAGYGFTLTRFLTYTTGSIVPATWDRLWAVLPWLAVAMPVALLTARTLNVLQLGDDVAAGLGMKVTRARFALLLVAVLLVAPVVSVVGPIVFVALLSPHLARALTGTGNAYAVLPASAAVGAVVVLVADACGRLLFFPTEIPAGLFTIAVVGPIAVLLAGFRLRAAPVAAGYA